MLFHKILYSINEYLLSVSIGNEYQIAGGSALEKIRFENSHRKQN